MHSRANLPGKEWKRYFVLPIPRTKRGDDGPGKAGGSIRAVECRSSRSLTYCD